MTIYSGDIKLVESQVMLDAPEGGGAPTANVILDGESNGIFPDISEVDRAGGRVNLRKVHATVQTLNTDGYFGANAIVADPPEDPNVSITLFTTNDVFDRRADAQARLESYLAYGPPFAAYLFGNHIAGQMTISLLATTTTTPPVVGSTLGLVKNEGATNELYQFVRVTSVTATNRDFEDEKGIFTRSEITLGITDPLRYDFLGFDAVRYEPAASLQVLKTRIRETVVANAARYYGIVPLSEAVNVGDFTVQGESIFTQLVPAGQTETPITDARLNQQSAALVQAGSAYTQTITQVFSTSTDMFVGGGILPGSLTLTRSGVTLVDLGGKLIDSATTNQVGTVDYANGVLRLTIDVFGASGGTHSVVVTPADTPTLVSETLGFEVREETQRLTWVFSIEPVPAKNSLQISYRAQGRWYVLSEDGSGAIRGSDSSYGVGTLNYTTGTVTLTLGALPDIGSKVLAAWAPGKASASIAATPVLADEVVLNNRLFFEASIGVAIKPGTLTVSWNDGSARTVTDAGGPLSGDGIGKVLYASGLIQLSPNNLPPAGTSFTINVTDTAKQEVEVSLFTSSGSNWTFSLGGTVKPKSVEMALIAFNLTAIGGVYENRDTLIHVYDDGAGNLITPSKNTMATIGTINYSTGACAVVKHVLGYLSPQGQWVFTAPYPSKYTQLARGAYGGIGYVYSELSIVNGTNSTPAAPAWAWWSGPTDFAAVARFSGTDGTSKSYAITPTAYRLSSGATRFRAGSDIYVCQNRDTGVLERNPSSTTGVGTTAGAVSFTPYEISSGLAPSRGGTEVTLWTGGVTSTVTEVSGALTPSVSGTGTSLITELATFRTSIAPIRNGSISIIGTWADGVGFNVSPNSAGEIVSGSVAGATTPGSRGVFGIVDYESGVVELRFGRRVPDSFATNDNVTDLSYLGIVGVKYVQIEPVRADTLRYNASAYTYYPLNATLLGLDPVRLPNDGRVPIFRTGDFAVIGNTQSMSPATVSNGQTLNCGRVRLSRVRVIGNDGLVINTGYTTNLDAGTVTFTNVSGYSQPVTVEHRIEDMAIVNDAQISGAITLARPSTHSYPVPGSYISSALVVGDLNARVSTLFDQNTWSNAWADAPVGSSATGSYNDVLAPIELSNKGAQTERWAIVFTNSTSFNVIGEHVGVIATGNISTDLAPNNPATGVPYFTLRAIGWGAGWVGGNVLRFNTVGCAFPVWVVRTVQAGPETVIDDSWTLLVRGDVDRP